MPLCRLLLAVAALMLAPGAAFAQVPDTDIWVVGVRGEGATLRFGQPVNVTRRPGYDNQPCFLIAPAGDMHRPDATCAGFLFASADSSGSTDIFRWDPKSGATARVTRTPESEYSPTPFGDRRGSTGFCSVRVEADGTQRLWRFDLDGSNPRPVLSDVDSVGYFAWIDERHVAVFVLGNEARKEPHTLRVVDVPTQSETIVARNVGRAILRIPGSNAISFAVQEDDDTYRFMILRPGRAAGEPLIAAVGAGQDAAWLGETMLMSSGTTIYASDSGAGSDGPGRRAPWRAVADFADLGISGITRIAPGPCGRLAFVAANTAP